MACHNLSLEALFQWSKQHIGAADALESDHDHGTLNDSNGGVSADFGIGRNFWHWCRSRSFSRGTRRPNHSPYPLRSVRPLPRGLHR